MALQRINSADRKAGMQRFFDYTLTLCMLTCFTLGAWFWSQRTPPKAAVDQQHQTAATTPTSGINSKDLETQSIETIQLSQRVVGRNPLRHETSAPSKVDPKTWRAIRLTMDQNGVQYQLAFLRDLNWLRAVNATEGSTIELKMPEMGLDGPALVESISECPPIELDDGSGRMIVTGTMSHLASNVLGLHVTGLDEPIGVTDTHPIWSESREAFVTAGQLRVGEHLRSASGVVSQVTRITPHRGPPQLTYNLEVDGEHVYRVSNLGLLVHNACPWDSWGIGEHALGNRIGHHWEKVLGKEKATLENIKPFVDQVLEQGQWVNKGLVRGKGGAVAGDKLEAVVNIKGADVWVSALRDLSGKIILNNAGVR